MEINSNDSVADAPGRVATPLLDAINSPHDLRKLPPEQLPAVCGELRSFLINALSSHSGHFASSMGAVELTVALHYVFNTPYDRIVWDVGHQAYPHKILTGRRDNFDTLRTFGGLSGFPSPKESPYDTFTSGHASNSISAALGMAVAAKLHSDEPKRNIVAVIGDASISGGLAFEGLNNAANSKADLLIILNDNDMSIDRNVGSLNSYLAHLTSSRGYNTLRGRMADFLHRHKLITDSGKGRITRFNNSIKSLLTSEQNIFEGLNIRYFGPFDGHDLPTIVKVLRDIKDLPGPRILHLRTVKGKGYLPAEKDPAAWHAPGLFNAATGERLKPLSPRPPKYQDIFGDTLVEIARKDPRVVAVTAAMPSGTSVNKLAEVMPERTFDVGISEGHAVTFAGGMAKDGLRPFVAIYSAFLQRAYSHIIHDVAIDSLPVTLCIDRAGLVGEDGPTHHGVFDLAYLRSIPGMTVSAPRDGEQLRRLMYTSLTLDSPMAIRYPRGEAPAAPAPVTDPIRPGTGELLNAGTGQGSADVAVITIGQVAADASKAIEKASDQLGMNIVHWDARFLKPLDENMMRKVVTLGCPIVTVEDGTVHGGLGSAILEWISDHPESIPGGHSRPKVIRMGVPDRFIPHGKPSELHKLCGFDSEGIFNTLSNLRS